MNRPLSFLLSSFALLCGSSVVAQIEDNDASSNLLAMQCSMSSGLPPSNYEEYCRKLAKTVGLLNPKQQERVFGYLPRPAVVASGDLNNYGSPSNAGGSVSSNSPAPSVNPLVAVVGDFNNAISGSVDNSGAIIGGTPPATSGTTDPAADSGNAASDASNWWGDLLNWWGGVIESLIDQGKDPAASVDLPSGEAVGWTSGANGKLVPPA